MELSAVGLNPGIQPLLRIWGWEVAAYLFFGGLVAGLMIVTAWRERAGQPLPGGTLLLAPALLSVGMLALFLDLEHKLHVWRFYTSFSIASPMSWGSWILLLVYPAMILQMLRRLDIRVPYWPQVNMALGGALGIYTGILLSALGARPLWNTPLLGPLFLLSGLSSAVALLALLVPAEREWLSALDLKLIAAEAGALVLLLIGMATGGEAQRGAARLLLGGDFTGAFWAAVAITGMVLPAGLELLHRRGRAQDTLVAPVLVLCGGFALRAVILLAGQASHWGIL
ncbi:MAG: polysulfide reductase NrfD [Acidobacteria bacterium]|nr:polysulfide reductase NrfD [Acidobacteriota bacterium]